MSETGCPNCGEWLWWEDDGVPEITKGKAWMVYRCRFCEHEAGRNLLLKTTGEPEGDLEFIISEDGKTLELYVSWGEWDPESMVFEASLEDILYLIKRMRSKSDE